MNVRSESLYFLGPSQNIAWAPPSSASKTTKEEPGTASWIPCAIFTGTFDTRPPMTRVGSLTNAHSSLNLLGLPRLYRVAASMPCWFFPPYTSAPVHVLQVYPRHGADTIFEGTHIYWAS